jgi:hypothetical protein
MIQFKDSTHYLNWFFTADRLSEVLAVKQQNTLSVIETHFNFQKHNMFQGANLTEKASKFIIKANDEEKILSDWIDTLKNQYFPVYKDVNIICLAANYLQRFYLI